MRHAAGYGNQFWINTGIMLDSVLIAVLFSLLAHNRKQTLGSLSDEIERREDLFENDYAALADLALSAKLLGSLQPDPNPGQVLNVA